MAICIICGRRIWGKDEGKIYLYSKDPKTGQKVETEYPIHDACYDSIKDNIRVAGTRPDGESDEDNNDED